MTPHILAYVTIYKNKRQIITSLRLQLSNSSNVALINRIALTHGNVNSILFFWTHTTHCTQKLT